MSELNNEVAVEIVVTPERGIKSAFDEGVYITSDNVDEFRAPIAKSIEVARKIQNQGFRVDHVGSHSISARATVAHFESFFGTKVSEQKPPANAKAPSDYIVRAPLSSASWSIPTVDGLDSLIHRAYIQQTPIFFADERPLPPHWEDKFRLRVPGDISQLMQAASVHRRGINGKGVKVVMADTGFYHHKYFQEQGYNFLAINAPDQVDHTTDASGHGTGECANLFATAPGINFVGVKMGNPTLAIKTAVELRPDIMTNSWGFSVDLPDTGMPNWLKPLHLALLDAVARGITVCFSAGNGHFGFPGCMPEVISVGGVHIDEKLRYSATQYASGFSSTWFPGRRTPDVCGLVGTLPTADYIVLPVQPGASLDKGQGWGAFSGTSAASPMVAGICALLKQVQPDLLPHDIKCILQHTGRDIVLGTNAQGHAAVAGPDSATGFGLADAARAIETLL